MIKYECEGNTKIYRVICGLGSIGVGCIPHGLVISEIDPPQEIGTSFKPTSVAIKREFLYPLDLSYASDNLNSFKAVNEETSIYACNFYEKDMVEKPYLIVIFDFTHFNEKSISAFTGNIAQWIELEEDGTFPKLRADFEEGEVTSKKTDSSDEYED